MTVYYRRVNRVGLYRSDCDKVAAVFSRFSVDFVPAVAYSSMSP